MSSDEAAKADPAVPTNVIIDDSDEEEEGPKITQVDHINAKLLNLFKAHINENEERFVEVAGADPDNDTDDADWESARTRRVSPVVATGVYPTSVGMGAGPSTSAKQVNIGANIDNVNRKQELYDLHQYLEDPEDLGTVDPKNPPLIWPEIGFRTELGGKVTAVEETGAPVLEEVEKHSLFYKDKFCDASREGHTNYIGGNAASPLIISLVQLDKVKRNFNWKAIVRTKKDDLVYDILAPTKVLALKELGNSCPDLMDITLLEVRDPKLVEDLKHMEDRLLIKAYKFGVVYCKEGQSDETEMFSNEGGSKEFNEFMDFIGEKTKLKGYKGYKAGLDVEHNTTGAYSYTAKHGGFEIMYHVSTMLPFSKANPQQVERKRHIGNDVVVIVFQDGPTPGFKPTTITSKFNHVYIVVQVIKSKRKKSSSAMSPSNKPPSRGSSKLGKVPNKTSTTALNSRSPSNIPPLSTAGVSASSPAVISPKGAPTSKSPESQTTPRTATTTTPRQNTTPRPKSPRGSEPSAKKSPAKPATASKRKSSGSLKSPEKEKTEKLTNNTPTSGTPRGRKESDASRDRAGSTSKDSKEPVFYKVAIVSKHGVRPHSPVLPKTKVFQKNEEFHSWLMTKLVNSERAAYYAPGFAQSRTRRLWLKDLLEKYTPDAIPLKK